MVNRNTASALTIAALLACAIPAESMASALFLPIISSVLGQATPTPTFTVPDSVAQDTEVVISSSSDNMKAISEALGAGFEGEYDNSKVSIENKDANAAIQDVLNGNADLAAISRPLTTEEQGKGLIAVPVRREKIAIVVNKDNPFAQSITGSQFAQIFRGEIKDWAEVGGDAGPIKLVDRPATSETRLALSPYPVFTTAPFNAAAGATTLEEDTTGALVTALGPDGISYVLVGELDGQPDLKALQLHKTPPSDPRYPFSQPYAFVYAGGASPEVSAFLGYATGNPGQAAVNNAGVSGIGLIPDAGNGTETANAGTAAPDTPAADTPDSAADTPAAESEAADTEGTTPDDAADGTTLEANNVMVAGLDGEIGTEDDINIVGPDGVLGTADDIRGIGPDGEIGTADDLDLAGPDGVPGTEDDVNLAGPDGEIGTADDVAFAGTTAEGGADVDADGGGLGDLAANGRWWWLLLPLAGLGLLIWAAGRRGNEEEAGYVANVEGNDGKALPQEDRIRSNFGEDDINFVDPKDIGLEGLDTDVSGTKVSGKGLGIGKVAASGAAIAGGTAIAGKGLASSIRNKAGDVTMDLQDGVSGSVKGDIDGVKGNVQGGIDGIKGGMKCGIDGARGSVQGSIDSVKGNVQGGIDGLKGSAQDGIDGVKSAGAVGLGASAAGLGAAGAEISGLRDKAQDGIDGLKDSAQDSIDGVKNAAGEAKDSGGSWLDRAKQRINEAAKDVKDTASELKDDVTKND